MFENNVAHGLVGDLLYLFGNLLLIMVDYVVGAQFARFFELGFVSCRGDHAGVKQLANLNGRRSHARSATQNQNGITGLYMGAAHQHVPGSHKNQGDGGCLIVSQIIGDRKNADARHGYIFSIAAIIQIAEHGKLRAKILLPGGAGGAVSAERHRGQQNTLPDFQVGDVFAHLGDVARHVAAVDMRELDPWQAFADKEIKMVQSTGLYPHEYLVFADLHVGNIFILQNFRTAKFMEAYGFHQLSPGKPANVTRRRDDLPLDGSEEKIKILFCR